jgi:hypothetical protein
MSKNFVHLFNLPGERPILNPRRCNFEQSKYWNRFAARKLQACKAGKPSRLIIEATQLQAHRTAASHLKKGLFPDISGARRAA